MPAYWGLGQSRFDGYELLRRREHIASSEAALRAGEILQDEGLLLEPQTPIEKSHARLLDNISRLPITTGNTAELLVDGEETFDAILSGMEEAKDYILFQFYILRDDELGQKCKETFLRKAAEGIRVYVLYDELGSKDLSPKYPSELRAAGVEIVPFNTTQGRGNRLWIVSPYFVPDEQLMSALQLAALRGVDVRILIPQNPDHLHVYLSGISYLEEAKEAGVKIYRYQPGFLHQKVWLIDDYASAIGTANLDNRSMRLNFEITMLMLSKDFAGQVEQMLEADFAKSKLASAAEYTERSLPYRFLVRVCRLLAPIQ